MLCIYILYIIQILLIHLKYSLAFFSAAAKLLGLSRDRKVVQRGGPNFLCLEAPWPAAAISPFPCNMTRLQSHLHLCPFGLTMRRPSQGIKLTPAINN